MHKSRARSISHNLTISLVVVIVIISIAFISIYSFLISKRIESQLENTADEYIDSIASNLEIPLWDVDRENIRTICNYYIQNDLIIMIKLIDVSGEIIYQHSMVSKVKEEDLLNRSRDIFYNKERIGNVMISLSPFQSRETKLDVLKASMIAMFISVIGLVFSTGILMKKLLKKPMDSLGRMAKSYSRGDYHPQLNGLSYREFQPLLSVMVDMGETIESQMNELQKARDQLEFRVVERTEELDHANKQLSNEIVRHKNTIMELEATLKEIRTLRGILPICSHCKKVRNDQGYWDQIESYIKNHSEADFSHSICPECAAKYYPNVKFNDD